MKRITAIALALLMLVGGLVACGNNAEPDAPAAYEGTLTELVTKIYETQPLELPVMTEGMAVDLADEYAVKAYLGLDSAEGIAEAVFSETMMGAQAYSLVIAKVSDTSKTEELKNAMFSGIDTRKWICVAADQLRVVSSADLIMLVMIDSSFGEGLADGLVDAFKTNVGELTGETLTQG